MAQGALGIEIKTEVSLFDSALGASFLPCLACGAFTRGQAWIEPAFGESPLPGAGIYEQEFHRWSVPAIANCRHLDRQSRPERKPRQTSKNPRHEAPLTKLGKLRSRERCTISASVNLCQWMAQINNFGSTPCAFSRKFNLL